MILVADHLGYGKLEKLLTNIYSVGKIKTNIYESEELQKLGGKAHGFNRGMEAKKFIFLYLCVYFP